MWHHPDREGPTGVPDQGESADVGFTAFYAICLAFTWFVYIPKIAQPADRSVKMTDPVLPLHLSLVGRLVVVVGGGPIGARKVASALDAGAVVRLITPWACSHLTALADAGRVRWLSRNYWAGDLTGAWLTFAATADPKVNEAVQLEANTRRIFCVRADSAADGSARCPAVLRRDELVVSVSSAQSAGSDPGRVLAVRDAMARAMDTGTISVPRQRAPGLPVSGLGSS